MRKEILPPSVEESDLFKLNSVIHKLDDAMGGDYLSSLAMQLREIRDQLFDGNGDPIAYRDSETPRDTILTYINK